MQNISEELVTQAEAVAPAERRCDSRADHDFAMGKCQDIGRGRVAQVKLVKAAAFLGRNKNDTELRGEVSGDDFPEGAGLRDRAYDGET